MCLKIASFVMDQALQQEKHVLLRKLEVNELESGQKEAELVADLAAAKAELERHHSQGRDRRRDESGQLIQLANHNQRLVEQLSEVMKQRTSLHVLCVTQMGGGGNAAEQVQMSQPHKTLHNVLSHLLVSHPHRP